MKQMWILLTVMLLSVQLKAERGDVVSYELVKVWNNTEVVNYCLQQTSAISGIVTDPNLKVVVDKLLKAYFKRNINARSLKFYKVIYETVDFNRNPTTASGIIIVPQRPSSTCTYGMALYGHGTVIERYDVPSRIFEGRFRNEFFYPVLLGAMEHVTCVPDYYGLGDGPGMHHHNMAFTNATSSIDIIRAGRNLVRSFGLQVNNRLVITGYSEGGTNTMATAKMIYDEHLESEFPIILMGPASGAYDLDNRAYHYIVDNPYYPTNAYILTQAAGCQDMYGEMYDSTKGTTVSDYFKPPYDQLYMDNVPAQNGNVGWVPMPWTGMFKEGVVESIRNNPEHPFRTCLKRNNTYDWPNPNETYMYYCYTDEQVPPSGAEFTYQHQTAMIPAQNFWDRFRYQLFEMSFDGVFYDHAICSVPSYLHFMEVVRSRKKNRCQPGRYADYNEEKVYHTAQLVSDQEEEINVVNIRGESVIKTNISPQKSELDISSLESGFYVVEKNINGQSDYDYFIKQPIKYVRTSDYNPIVTQPMVEGTDLDISRLKETVKRLEILDAGGKRIKVIPNETAATDKIFIARTSQMSEGDYTVLVITEENTYPLLMKVGAKKTSLDASKLLFSANVQNGKLTARAGGENVLRTLEIFNVSGQQITAVTGLNSNVYEVDTRLAGMSAGVYLVQLTGTLGKETLRVIVQ